MRHTIIGGGLAGLTAANALASVGKVTLFEQSEHLGGRAITQRQNGFSLNLGPHALYCGGAARRAFSDWKIPFEGHAPQQRPGFLVYQGRKFPLITGTASLLTSSLFSLKEKIEAANLLRLFTAGRAPRQSMSTWIDDHTRSIKVRHFAAAITRLSTFTAAQRHLSADAALKQIAMGFAGVLYLDDGWQTLIDGLAARARSLGVEIRCGAEPQLDHHAILAIPPASVDKLTGASLPQLHPVRVACLDLCLRVLPGDAANFALGVDQPLYFSVHSSSARLAPSGQATIQIAKYLDDDATATRAELEAFADLLAPGWRDHLLFDRFLPHMTVSHAIASGARPAVDAVPGYLLAGDWVGEEGMLADAAVASALKAAGVVQGGKSARNAA